MPELICPEELTRKDYLDLLKINNNYIFIKFGAEWCKPCQKIKEFIKTKCSELPDSVYCYDIDVDENFDVYVFMKSKKMIPSIPCMLIYRKDNTSYPPDFILSSSNELEIESLFNCMKFN